MKKFIKLSSIIVAISMLFCLSGCGKSESDYKSAISEHMRSEHGVYINSYQSFDYDNKGASADANVTEGHLVRGAIRRNTQVCIGTIRSGE